MGEMFRGFVGGGGGGDEEELIPQCWMRNSLESSSTRCPSYPLAREKRSRGGEEESNLDASAQRTQMVTL